jgi:hypothetical protein
MEKAFDLKGLVKELQEKGLPVAEQMAEQVADAVFTWCLKSAELHTNAIVKAAVPLAVQTIKPIVAHELNKIDGQEG